MRIKAVEGIKAYNRDADLSALRMSACFVTYVCYSTDFCSLWIFY